ncbi:MAG: F0F1 ATP synthase subunit A, partial [Planctomycetota bacterium]
SDRMFLLAADPAASGPEPVNPLGHVLDINLIGGDNGGQPLLTMHMVTLVVAAALALWALNIAAGRIQTGGEGEGNRRFVTGSRFAGLIEVVILYMRDNVISPVLGKDLARRYLPLLLSIFFFIWANNLLGLVPILDINHLIGYFAFGDKHWAVIGGTATGNIAVTAGLATLAFFFINIHGIRDLGFGGWCHHMLGGAPAYLAPIMVPIEIAGLFIKPVALAIRLFANMLAGHTLMATLGLFSLITIRTVSDMGGGAGVAYVAGAGVGLVALAASVAIMFLTTIFIGQLTHHHDGHEHEHDHGHGHEGHAEPAAAH